MTKKEEDLHFYVQILLFFNPGSAVPDYIWKTPMAPAANTVMMLRIHR